MSEPAPFVEPARAIFSQVDLTAFLDSKAYQLIISFVKHLNESVKGKKISDTSYPVSKNVQSVVDMLGQLDKWITEIPPIQQPMRFGNKAFRTWYERLEKECAALHEVLLPQSMHSAIVEISRYLLDSFGNYTRIDYGTGHETSFICWLLCMHKIGFLQEEDFPAIVLRIFVSYLGVMRRLQTVYMLEPAGSHGVWGLDDYQCLVFYFGAAQMLGQRKISPGCIHNQDVLDVYAKDYMYLEAIKFIMEVKKGSPFSETSPMLNDISAVPNWEKVNGGMLKLFVGEVLSKLPVIQHMVFGSLIPSTWTPSQPVDPMPSGIGIKHPDMPIHAPNFNLEGATAKAPWVDAELLEKVDEADMAKTKNSKML